MDNIRNINQELIEELEKQKQRVRQLEQLLGERNRQESSYRSDLSRLGQAFQPAKIRAWSWENETRLTQYLPVEADVQDSWGRPARGVSFIEDRLLEAVHRDDQERLASVWDRAYQDHTAYDVQYRLVTGDGTVRHQHEIATPEFNETGRYLGHVGTTQDITEQKLAEEALEQSARLLAEAERVANIGHWKWDEEGHRVTFCSEQAAAIFGLSVDDFVAGAGTHEAYLQLVVPEDRQAVDDAVRAFYREFRDDPWGTKPLELEYGIVRADGALRHIRERAGAAVNDRDVVSRSVGTIQDITEQKAAEQALRESEARYKGIVEDQTELISRFAPDGRRTFVNQAFCRYVGKTADEILGTSLYDVVHADQRNDLKAYFAEFTPQNSRREFENQLLRHDGEYRWFHWIDRAVFDDQDRMIELQSVGRDITDHKKMEAALRESENRYRNIFDTATAGIGRTLLEDGRVILSNEKLAQMFGYDSVDEFVSEFVFSDHYVDPGDRARLMSHYKDSPGTPIECTFTKRDGSPVIVQAHAIANYEEGILDFVATDITERKSMEERLRQAQKMEAVGQLTGGVAHDFNNLLAVIMGNTELLQDRLGREGQPLNAVLRAATRGAELTQRLLAFSRRQPLRPQVIDLGRLVSGMSEMLIRTLGETIEVESEADPDLWGALADPGQVENAVLNLALNARDAMSGGGKLTIECANAFLDDAYVAENLEVKAGDYVVLAVSDEGSGMAPEVQAHAFEPFYTTKEVGQGSGLGLSMVYGFAKQSGGHVIIYSEEGHGTTVKLYLPRAGQASKPEEAPASEKVPRGQGEVILVIEDDPDVRNLAVQMLEGLGYRVIDVPDAASAHKVLADGTEVDLVLSDVVLPGGISGPEFAEEARTTYPDLKIIFMSGYPAEAAKRKGFLGSDKVLLNKPFQRLRLAKVLREALDRSSAG
jgi:PAS domain S-box-containing protein